MEARMDKIGVKETITDCDEKECGYFYKNLCGKGLSHKTDNCMDTNKPKIMMLNPPPDLCQECAVKHDPESPHNKNSLYYQMKFHSQNGRWPSWEDAMVHCPDSMKKIWIEEFESRGIEWRTVNISNEIKREAK